MAENKTAPTQASVDAYLAARASPEQLVDCHALVALCQRVTGQPPAMWGPSIVGFGAYRYTTPGGRSGEAPLAGFAVRGRELVLYLDVDDAPRAALLAQLGTHRTGKACLYLRRLADVDAGVLEALVTASVAGLRQRHG